MSRSIRKFNKYEQEDLCIKRVPVTPNQSFRDGQLRAVAELVDLTPAWGVDLGGVGYKAGRFTDKSLGRLFATVVLLDDGNGQRLLLIACDLHSGSRYITESLGACLAKSQPELGVGVEQIWMMASHTHSGPGHLYAEMFYDQLASKKVGFDKKTADDITSKLYRAASAWTDASKFHPAKLGSSSALLWGWLWNRSHLGYMANLYHGQSEAVISKGLKKERTPAELNFARAASRRLAGVEAPDLGDVDLGRYCVDPRLQGIHIMHLDDTPIATIGILHATPTIMPAGAKCMTGDATAIAAQAVRLKLARPDYPINIVAGAMGDVNVTAKDETVDNLRRKRGSRYELNQEQMAFVLKTVEQAGEALALAVDQVMVKTTITAKAQVPLSTRFGEWDLVYSPVGDGRKLAREHAVGKSVLAGAELSRPKFWDTKKSPVNFKEQSYKRQLDGGRVIKSLKSKLFDNLRRREHAPKSIGIVNLLRVLTFTQGRSSGALVTLGHQAQLRFAQLGDLKLVGWPVEPTIGLSEQMVAQLGGKADDWILCGLVGGFIGYATTLMEYRVQDYEGASNLWGRNFGDWLIARTREMALNTHSKTHLPEARFATRPIRKTPIIGHVRVRNPSSVKPLNAFSVVYNVASNTLEGSWFARDAGVSQSGSSLGSLGWVIQVRRRGQPLVLGTVEVNDLNFPTLIRRQVTKKKRYARWSFVLNLPQGSQSPPPEVLSFCVVASKPFTP